MPAQQIALVRGVPDTFDQAISSDPAIRLDVDAARAEHAEYVRHLRSAGYELAEVPADPVHPDCVFVEDTAVVLGGVAVATRPGAQSRRGEVGPVRERLETWFEVVPIEAPGTLDGGDVIVTTDLVLIGRSGRTNPEGVAQLAEIVSARGLRGREVLVEEGLHLKSAVLPLDEQTVVVTRGAVDEEALTGLRILYEDEAERFRFSALPLADGSVLVTANAARTVTAVAGLGFEVDIVDVTQIQAADGGLTCLSVLFDTP